MRNIITHNKTGSYSGFLGNIMFQTAATIGTAVKHGMQAIFPHKADLDNFAGPINQQTVSHIAAIDVHENGYHYTPIELTQGNNYNLNGYFQSIKYWEHCQSLIRQIFKFNNNVENFVQNKYLAQLNGLNTLVSLHVRRGDYVNLQHCHPVLPIQYYVNAAQRINGFVGSNIIFVVFSDDIEWCKQNFTQPVFEGKLLFAEGNSPAQDMCFMSLCKHNIIANSSFSWWGSFLNQNPFKLVMAPPQNKWYGPTYADWNLNDMYLPTWTIVEF